MGLGFTALPGDIPRNLMLRDFEREEERKWGWLRDELKAGVEADETEEAHFVPLDVTALLQKAKARRDGHGYVFPSGGSPVDRDLGLHGGKWDEAQAGGYVSELLAEIGMAARRRFRWRPVTDRALRGVGVFRHRHYFVFFRELSEGGIGVITVLH